MAKTKAAKRTAGQVAMEMTATPADPAAEIQQEVTDIVKQAAACAVIASPEQYDMAGEMRKAAMGVKRRITDLFKPLKQRADEAKRALLDAERKELDPVERAIGLIDEALLGWQRKLREERAAEEARLRKIAERRAELERQAAALELEEQGAADAEVEEALAAPLVVATVVPKTELAKSDGLVTRTTWKARVTNKRALIDYVSAHPRLELDELLDVNEAVANRMARAARSASKVPGIEFYEVESIAGRS